MQMANRAYPCSRDGNGLRPIHLASRHGKPHMVNYIIDMGTSLETIIDHWLAWNLFSANSF